MIGTIIYKLHNLCGFSFRHGTVVHRERHCTRLLVDFFANMSSREYCDIHIVHLFKEQS